MLSLKQNKSSHWIGTNVDRFYRFSISARIIIIFQPIYLLFFDRAGGSCDKFSGLPCQPPALAWNMTKYNINTVYTLGHTHTIPILNTGCNCKAVRSCGLWRYKLQRTANLPAKRHNLPILAAGLSCLCWQIFCNFDCLPQIRSLVWCRPNHRNTDDADALTHTQPTF